ncbi:MAG: gliding motility-associated C-terminal domain-containing protein [Flavobacteriaceae bacterium]|nr:gliding motility-associated C-terminal domain-containing protein [Flavobacteriaceae bacterium]
MKRFRYLTINNSRAIANFPFFIVLKLLLLFIFLWNTTTKANDLYTPKNFDWYTDTDQDGIADAVDIDDDNDGLLDTLEGSFDWDNDGVPNSLDIDSDGDGILDNVEAQSQNNFITPCGEDIDGNGLDDHYESSPGSGEGLTPLDTDSDTHPDFLDVDSDNDGIWDNIEALGPAFFLTPWDLDTDANGLDDRFETSPGNGDGLDPTDVDLDGVFDFRDIDADNDGLIDILEAQEQNNFIAPTGIDANSNGMDDVYESIHPYCIGLFPINSDADLIRDFRDIDADNDGIPDNVEAQLTIGYIPPSGNDADGNGLDDAYALTGLVPVNTDGLDLTDHLDADTDNDSLLDYLEAFDANHDGMPDMVLSGLDSDCDGLDDAFEGSDIYDNHDVNDELDNGALDTEDLDNDATTTGDVDFRDTTDDRTDTDGDEVPDVIDIDDDNDGILDTVEGDADTDNDGYINRLDIDADNDGIPDNVEAQSTEGYIAPSGVDADKDGLDDAYDFGASKGLTPINFDSEDQPDFLDLDTDNDSVFDFIEAFDSNKDGQAEFEFTANDQDADGLDDAFEGSDANDGFDVNDELDNGAIDTEDTDGTEDVDFRDIDDDGDDIITIDEDPNNNDDLSDDDTDGDGIPNYLDPIEDDSSTKIEVSELVTPNGDGKNEFWRIKNIELYPENEVYIFNRWGVEVFHTKSYINRINAGFTGESQARVTVNKDKLLPAGVYYYIIKYKEEQQSKQIKGFFYMTR